MMSLCSLVSALWHRLSLWGSATQQNELLFWGGFSSAGDFVLEEKQQAYRWFYFVIWDAYAKDMEILIFKAF